MPEVINLKFSDPYPLVDPTIKSTPLDGVFPEDVYHSGVQVEREKFDLSLDVLSPDDKALIEFGKPLFVIVDPHKDGGDEEEEESTQPAATLLIQRKTNDLDADSWLAGANLIINIGIMNKQNDDQPVVVELDIDPEIKFGINHVYTFTSINTHNNKNNVVVTSKISGDVRCRLFDGDKNILDTINSVTEDKQGTSLTKTEFNILLGQLGIPLSGGDAHPIVASAGANAQIELEENANTFYALVLTGIGRKVGTVIKEDPSKYGLAGRFRIDPNQLL